jgi:hypothetical protein
VPPRSRPVRGDAGTRMIHVDSEGNRHAKWKICLPNNRPEDHGKEPTIPEILSADVSSSAMVTAAPCTFRNVASWRPRSNSRV